MRATTILLATIAAMLSQAVFADIVRHASIPSQFIGTWAASTDDCNKAGKSAIVLSATSYAEGAKVCTVDWVDERPGANAPIYSAHLKCAAPENQPSNIVLWKKAADQISAGATLDTLKTLQRCPAK